MVCRFQAFLSIVYHQSDTFFFSNIRAGQTGIAGFSARSLLVQIIFPFAASVCAAPWTSFTGTISAVRLRAVTVRNAGEWADSAAGRKTRIFHSGRGSLVWRQQGKIGAWARVAWADDAAKGFLRVCRRVSTDLPSHCEPVPKALPSHFQRAPTTEQFVPSLLMAGCAGEEQGQRGRNKRARIRRPGEYPSETADRRRVRHGGDNCGWQGCPACARFCCGT